MHLILFQLEMTVLLFLEIKGGGCTNDDIVFPTTTQLKIVDPKTMAKSDVLMRSALDGFIPSVIDFLYWWG